MLRLEAYPSDRRVHLGVPQFVLPLTISQEIISSEREICFISLSVFFLVAVMKTDGSAGRGGGGCCVSLMDRYLSLEHVVRV